jgi:hypothetical protein
MADLALIERALRNADATGDTEAATRLAAAYREEQARQGAAQAPPAAAPDKPVSQFEGFKQGLGNALDNAAEAASNIPVIGPTVDKVGQMIGLPSTANAVASNREARANSPEAPGGWGRFAGDVAATLPLTAVFPAGLPGTLAAGAAGGAMTADPGHQIEGGLLGAGAGGALHGLGGLVTKLGTSREVAPTIDALKNQAREAYQVFDDSGHMVAAPAYNNLVTGIKDTLTNEGLDATLHPNATAAYNRLAGEQGNKVTFQGMDILRKIAGDVGSAAITNPADARMGYFLKSGIDDFMGGLKPEDLVPGQGAGDPNAAVEALNRGRDLWSRAAQASTIQDAIDKAAIKASGYSQSGDENALRAQFRQLALNDRASARLAPAVQEAVNRVAAGTPGGNLARTLGKLAPRGPVSTLGAIGTGAATGTGPVIPMLVGEAAKYAATRGTRKAAQAALDTAALGHAPAATVNPGASALADIFYQLARFGGAAGGQP